MRLVGIVTVAATLASAAVAEARIVVQRSIAGIAPDMSKAQVLERLGDTIERRKVEDITVWTFPGRLKVTFQDGHQGVTTVTTESRRERTAKGLGVGSTRKQVKRALKGEHCTKYSCTLGTFANMSMNTSFGFGAGGGNRVESVSVRRQVIDVWDQSPR